MATRGKYHDLIQIRERLDKAFPEGLVVADHSPTEHWYKNTRTGTRAASVTTKQGIINKGYLKQWAVNLGIGHIERYIELNNGSITMEQFQMVRGAAAGQHENDLKSAADYGTNAHGAIDLFCQEWIRTGTKGDTATIHLKEGAPAQEIAACRSFDKFIKEVECVPVASELKVWYEVGKDVFAGTVDSILLVREVYKERAGDTSGYCHHDYAIQPNGLEWCYKCGRTVTRRLILGDWKTSNSIQGKDDYAEQANAYAKAIEVGANLKFDDVWIVRLSKEKALYEVQIVIDRKGAWARFQATSRNYDTRAKFKGPLLAPLAGKEIITL